MNIFNAHADLIGSLKYHRLHPEYIYTRIRNLQGRYNLRVLLTMVDIPNHEDCLRELSKTSLVNNVTLILCWSAAEAARYLELYKSYEHANYSAIRGVQATSYAEKLVEFVTVPRAVNKADAVALVSTFGSLRNAVNADPDTIGVIGGWGEKKVRAWCHAVDEPFRAKKAAKRALDPEQGHGQGQGQGQGAGGAKRGPRRRNLDEAMPLGRVPLREMAGIAASRSRGEEEQEAAAAGQHAHKRARLSADAGGQHDHQEDEDAEFAAAIEESKRMAEAEAEARARGTAGEPSSSSSSKTVPSRKDDELGDGIAAALAKLRQGG